MYTGENKTAIRSMQWLETALLRLLETETYTKITVKDICKEADLSRQTFYQMFDSKDEVMEYAFGVLHAESLFAGHNPDNTASGSVLRKLDFTYTGDEYYPPTGLKHPSYILKNTR